MNRKGSLNLSIQAIVVLVMAMAVLGLGLGFIRTLMGQGQGQFEEAIANAKLKNPASADKPITIGQTIKVKQGKMTTFEVGVYNNGDAASDGNTVSLNLSNDPTNCPVAGGLGVTDNTKAFNFSSISQDINPGEAGGFLVSIKAGSDMRTTAAYICSIEAGSLSKQFLVNVVT